MPALALGSPPLMREGLCSSSSSISSLRITPAYAGRTLRKSCNRFRSQDHPRLCGKDSPFALASCFLAGSPPLMREGPEMMLKNNGMPRITPAYAGRTVAERHVLLSSRDHPRLCGKDIPKLCSIVISPGSPPLMREGHS